MNFCSDNQNPSQTIKKIENNNRVIHITYFDEKDEYKVFNKETYEKLLNQMINESKIRDKDESMTPLKIKKIVSQLGMLLSIFGTIESHQKNITYSYYLFIVAFIYMTKNYVDINKKIYELKKYKIYLELIKDGKKEINNISEPDHYYRKNISIDNIDNYSLATLKFIKKYKNKIN